MANNKRIFVSFAAQDKFARDSLVNQANEQGIQRFDFADMSVKDILDAKWREKCRAEIKDCAGLIAFISKNTPDAQDECWEIKCAREEGIPIRAFWIHKDEPYGKPIELGSTPVVNWNWETISNFIYSL